MSRFKPIHLGILLAGVLPAVAYAFLPWWQAATVSVRGQSVPRRTLEYDAWKIPGVRPEIAIALAAFATLWLLLRQARRPVQDMTTESMVRYFAVGSTLFFLIMLVFPSEVLPISQLQGLQVEIDQGYALGYWVAFGASGLLSLLSLLNRTPSYVEPEWDEEYAEGEYEEGEYEEGEYEEGEYDDAGYDDAEDAAYVEDEQAGPEDTPRH